MFESPMPKASGKPVAVLPVPRPTPTASPSGMLCSVIAMTNSQIRRRLSACGPWAAFDEMLVWDQQIQPPETGRPQQNSSTDHTRPGACFKRRQDQGEEGCRQHDSGGEAQQSVLHPLGNAAHKQKGQGSQAGGGAGREAG